jgi:glucose dehydrogenase
MRYLVATALLVAGTATIAQTPTPEQQAKAAQAGAAMKAADKNGDGKWDAAEWKAAGRNERGFKFADTDKDGFVTPAELKAAAAKRGG